MLVSHFMLSREMCLRSRGPVLSHHGPCTRFLSNSFLMLARKLFGVRVPRRSMLICGRRTSAKTRPPHSSKKSSPSEQRLFAAKGRKRFGSASCASPHRQAILWSRTSFLATGPIKDSHSWLFSVQSVLRPSQKERTWYSDRELWWANWKNQNPKRLLADSMGECG